jgi:cyclophilin family peptidyl-prolyl cis-trans isomerase
MSASSGPSGASDDTTWPEPGRWDPPRPGGALLPPLAQPRDDERDDESSRLQSESAFPAPDAGDVLAPPSLSALPMPLPPEQVDLVPTGEPSAEPAEPAESAEPPEPAEPVRLVESAEPSPPPKRKRSGLAVALIDAIGILLVILAIALVGKAIADRRNGNTKDTSLPTSVTPTSVDPNAPPPTQPGRSISGVTPCPSSTGSEARATSFQKAPPLCIDVTKRYRATILTNKGALNLTLDAVNAPMTVNNFVVLARYHYFDNTVCPRIIPAYLFQCGDPTGKGTGGPGYVFPDELPAPGQFKVGSIAMATSLPDTNGSQFFIVLGSDGVSLPAKYSLFGHLDPSQDAVLTALGAAGTEQGTPTKELVTIESVLIVEG